MSHPLSKMRVKRHIVQITRQSAGEVIENHVLNQDSKHMSNIKYLLIWGLLNSRKLWIIDLSLKNANN